MNFSFWKNFANEIKFHIAMSAFPLPSCYVHFSLGTARMSCNLPCNINFRGCKMPDLFYQSASNQTSHDLIFSRAASQPPSLPHLLFSFHLSLPLFYKNSVSIQTRETERESAGGTLQHRSLNLPPSPK